MTLMMRYFLDLMRDRDRETERERGRHNWENIILSE